jgi:hypothetical protein
VIVRILDSKWANRVGIIIGIIALPIGVIGTKATLDSIDKREPIFSIVKPTISILDRQRLNEASITILDKQSNEINNDVFLVKFFFWNAGDEVILKNDVDEPLSIIINNKKANILDYKILKKTRDSAGIKLTQISDNKLSLEFKSLENSEGLLAQIIFAGDNDDSLEIIGHIRNAKINSSFYSNKGIESPKLWVELLRIWLDFFASITTFFLCFTVAFFLAKIGFFNSKFFLKMCLSIPFIAIFLILLRSGLNSLIINSQGLSDVPKKLQESNNIIDAGY